MSKPEIIESTDLPKEEVWAVEIAHSKYYQWVPVKESDLERVEPEDGTPYFTLKGERVPVVDSKHEGFKEYRQTVDEPTVTRLGIRKAGLEAENESRKVAGLAPRALTANLIRHLEDGPFPKHFPLESITGFKVVQGPDNLEAKLTSHFVENSDD